MAYKFREKNVPYYQDIFKVFADELHGVVYIALTVARADIAKLQYTCDENPQSVAVTMTSNDNPLIMLANALEIAATKLEFGTINCSVVITNGVPQYWKITRTRSIRHLDKDKTMPSEGNTDAPIKP